MNQILQNKKDKLQNKKRYSFQFYVSFFVIICIITYFLYKKHTENNFSKISDATNKSYSITQLYSNEINSNYTTNKAQVSIIGTIKIPKLDISYPIFSEYSDELLKISVCKFYGPEINAIGNLCIIGHNYNNGLFFGKNKRLKIGEKIYITDLEGNRVEYTIYNKYTTPESDTSYITRQTEGRTEVTLVTCDATGKNRLVVCARIE